MWGLCEGVPVATSEDKIRPCTSSEILAHEVISRGYDYTQSGQQRFVDARRARQPDLIDMMEEDTEPPPIPAEESRAGIETPVPEDGEIHSGDYWRWEDSDTLVRVHTVWRRNLFDPYGTDCLVDPSRLLHTRHTEYMPDVGDPGVIDDDWLDPDQIDRDLGFSWYGETWFSVLPVEDEQDQAMIDYEQSIGEVNPSGITEPVSVIDERNVRPRLESSSSSELLDHWRRTGTTGSGVDLLRQQSESVSGPEQEPIPDDEEMYSPDDPPDDMNLQAQCDDDTTDTSYDSDDDREDQIAAIAFPGSKKLIKLPRFGELGHDSEMVESFKFFL